MYFGSWRVGECVLNLGGKRADRRGGLKNRLEDAGFSIVDFPCGEVRSGPYPKIKRK